MDDSTDDLMDVMCHQLKINQKKKFFPNFSGSYHIFDASPKIIVIRTLLLYYWVQTSKFNPPLYSHNLSVFVDMLVKSQHIYAQIHHF